MIQATSQEQKKVIKRYIVVPCSTFKVVFLQQKNQTKHLSRNRLYFFCLFFTAQLVHIAQPVFDSIGWETWAVFVVVVKKYTQGSNTKMAPSFWLIMKGYSSSHDEDAGYSAEMLTEDGKS